MKQIACLALIWICSGLASCGGGSDGGNGSSDLAFRISTTSGDERVVEVSVVATPAGDFQLTCASRDLPRRISSGSLTFSYGGADLDRICVPSVPLTDGADHEMSGYFRACMSHHVQELVYDSGSSEWSVADGGVILYVDRSTGEPAWPVRVRIVVELEDGQAVERNGTISGWR